MPTIVKARIVRNKIFSNSIFPKFLHSETQDIVFPILRLEDVPSIAPEGFFIVEPIASLAGIVGEISLVAEGPRSIIIVFDSLNVLSTTNAPASTTLTPASTTLAVTTSAPCPPEPCTPATALQMVLESPGNLRVLFVPQIPLPRQGYTLEYKRNQDIIWTTITNITTSQLIVPIYAGNSYTAKLYPSCNSSLALTGTYTPVAATTAAPTTTAIPTTLALTTTLAPGPTTTSGPTTTLAPGVYPPYTPPPAGWRYSSNGSSLNLGNWFNLPMPVTSQYEETIAYLDLVNYTLS